MQRRSLLFAVPACMAMMTAASAQEAYKVHVLLPMTGGAAFLGNSVRTAMSLAEKQVNKEHRIPGAELQFVFHDDQSSPQVAVQLAQGILQERPAVVFGSAISAVCNAISPLMKETVLYCLSPGIHPAANSNIFSASTSSRDYIEALLRFFDGRGWKKVAVLTTTDSSGQDADRAFDDLAKERPDVHLVTREHMAPTDLSVSAQIEKIKQSGADAIIVWATSSSVSTVYRGLVQAGLNLPVAASTSTMTYNQMLQYADFLPKQLFFATPEWVARGDSAVVGNGGSSEQQKLYFAAMQSADAVPDAASETGWDPPMIVASVLGKLGVKASGEEVRRNIASITSYPGIDGTYDFQKVPQRGLGVTNTLVARWVPDMKQWRVVSMPGGQPMPER